MNKILHSLSLTVASVAMASTLSATPEVIDNFSTVPDGTGVGSVDGWSFAVGDNTAVVEDGTGFGGTDVAYMIQDGAYDRNLTGEQLYTAADGTLGLNFDFAVVDTTDAYRIFSVQALQNGGVNGFTIRFNGGTTNGSSDNYIQVTNGTGTSWSDIKLSAIADSAWTLGDWYRISMTFDLVSSGNGQNVGGTVTVYNLSNDTTLVDSVAFAGYGNNAGGPFDELDIVQIRSGTNNGKFKVGNIQLGTIPEASTTSMFYGLGMLITAGLLRKRNRTGK